MLRGNTGPEVKSPPLNDRATATATADARSRHHTPATRMLNVILGWRVTALPSPPPKNSSANARFDMH